MFEKCGIELDGLDRNLLDIIQTDFPIEPKPYAVLAKKLGVSEDEALARVTRLRQNGIIRRLGANFQSKKLGFVSTLCAAKVPLDKIDNFIARVNLEPGVTHNYEREHAYNIWFTLIADSEKNRDEILHSISNDTDVEVYHFPATKMYKVRVNFSMGH